jgi:hypothetical protein
VAALLPPDDVQAVELELELIQTHVAQKPMLRFTVCARCVARESKRMTGRQKGALQGCSKWLATKPKIPLSCIAINACTTMYAGKLKPAFLGAYSR